MSDDRYTEVSSQSWFSRIGDAFKGVLIGLILFLASFVLLFWNEGRAVQTYRALVEGGKSVISVPADRVEPGNEGKLVHVSGMAVTEAVVKDQAFQVSAKALKLARVVQMYQWKESSTSKTEKKLGGGSETTKEYSYSKEWSDNPIDSSEFKKADEHRNPGAFPCLSSEWSADPVTVGSFTLNRSQVSRIGNAEPLSVGADIPGTIPLKAPVKLSGGGYYSGKDPAAPEVGDVRVTFKVTNPGGVSLVAKQVGNTFESFTARNGKAIDLFAAGTVSADNMFAKAKSDNQMLTVILRVVGFFLMFFGLSMILKPLSILADVLPLLGDIIGVGTALIAFLVSLVLSCVTIAIAWIVYRPLVGIGLLIAGGVVGYFIWTRVKAKQAVTQ